MMSSHSTDISCNSSTSGSKPFPIRGDRTAPLVTVPHVIATIGLPARGKTYIARNLNRYFNWIGITTKVFNVGDYRRAATTESMHDFFRPDNKEAAAIRDQCAFEALNDMCCCLLRNEAEVGIFDATNTTRIRREMIYNTCTIKYGFRLFFIESICDDEEIIKENIQEVKTTNPDYKNFNNEKVAEDFLKRINHYRSTYEPLGDLDKNYSFIKIFNVGEKFLVNKVMGHIQSRIVYFLMNIHVTTRNIYFSRNGESVNNMTGKVGGDSELSERGRLFALALAKYINSQKIPDLQVWTSQLKRSKQTADFLEARKEAWKALNDISVGSLDEMTYDEVNIKFPGVYAKRKETKFHFRYPKGESYEDLVARLEPVIMELERQTNILVIGHQAVIRCLLSYFLDKNTEELPFINVPLHNVIKLTPVAYGCRMEIIPLNIESVEDT